MSSNKNIYDFTRTGGQPYTHCKLNVVKVLKIKISSCAMEIYK